MPPFKDISGQRFGMLVAMWPAGYKGARRDIMYLCQCECGERVPIRNGHLRNGIAKSCGCKSKRGVHGPRTLHGMTRTPELAAYCGANSALHQTQGPEVETLWRTRDRVPIQVLRGVLCRTGSQTQA